MASVKLLAAPGVVGTSVSLLKMTGSLVKRTQSSGAEQCVGQNQTSEIMDA